MYYIVPITNGELDIDYSQLVEGISISDTKAAVKLRNVQEVKESWQEITEEEFLSYKPQPLVNPPDVTTLLGQFIVQQRLENAATKQALDAIGKGIVQLRLK